MNKFERLLSTIVVSPKFIDMLNVLRYLYLYTYAVYGPVRLTVFIMKSKKRLAVLYEKSLTAIQRNK